MRLDKYLSQTTDLSRRQIRLRVRAGEVSVNGTPATDPAMHTDTTDRIALEGVAVAAPAPRYFMLHKPAGCICATRDRQHPTVIELLDEPRTQTLQIAGRLDMDATGLVLITDDGQWNHRLTAPHSHCAKTYRVGLAEPLDDKAIEHLQRGVWLHREKHRCRPAGVEPVTSTDLRLTITEGRYHQVKRMLAAVGNRVESLHRERIGTITLDPALTPGDYRPLTGEEVTRAASRGL